MSKTDTLTDEEKNELSKDFNFVSLMKFVFPSIFTFVFIAVYQMVDGYFIEKFVGDIAIGAVNLYMPVLYLLIALGIMLGTGANAIIVRKVGEGKIEEAGKTFSNTIIFSVVAAIIISVIDIIFADPIMKLCGATAGNIEYLKPYYMTLSSFSIAIMLQTALGILIIGEGKSVQAAIVIIIGGVLNCVLDYIFMKHLNMGIKGAAIATVIGYSSTVVYAFFYYIVAKKSRYKFKFIKINLKEIGQISFNGSSDMISNLAGGITSLVMNHLAFKYYGEIGVSALSIVLYFQFLIEAIFMGFTSAVEPIFSFHYGTGNTDMRKKVFKLTNTWILIVAIISSIIVYVFNKNIVSIFFKEGTEIFNITQLGLKIFVFASAFLGYNTFFSGLFTAFSNGVISGILSFLRSLVILVICLYLLSYLFGGIGLWIAWTVSEIISFAVSIVFVLKYKNKYEYL